jgi:hypothetical protein
MMLKQDPTMVQGKGLPWLSTLLLRLALVQFLSNVYQQGKSIRTNKARPENGARQIHVNKSIVRKITLS